MRIGFIGIGSMGRPMARNLLESGHQLTAYNRTRKNAEQLEPHGAALADDPAEAAAGRDVVITMVSDDDAIRDVVFGSESGAIPPDRALREGLEPGAIHLSMSTLGARTVRDLDATHSERDQRLVAAPVFGRPDFAESARLSVVAAGPDPAVTECKPIFESVGRQHFHVGSEPAKASIVKLTGNFTIAAMMETLGESFALMRKTGVDPEQFLDVINRSLYDSPLYENYGSIIANRDYEPAGFKLKLGHKDIRLALESAREQQAPMPLASMIHDHYLSAMARGWDEMDWAGLGKVAEQRAGLDNS